MTLRAQIKQLESQLISGFYEDEKPIFEQGAPHHELQELVTAAQVQGYVDKMEELRHALDESVKLQSHYAKLLNDYDGGTRRTFDTAGWLLKINEEGP